MNVPGPSTIADSSAHVDVAILGAGAGGLGLAIGLHEAGFSDYLIFERSDGVGGTWRTNTYPGAACDIQSHLYSYSFELNPSWSRSYASQPEILDYFERCADKYDIRRHLRCNDAVVDLQWVEDEKRWHLRSAQGTQHTARIVVERAGPLPRAVVPRHPRTRRVRRAGHPFSSLGPFPLVRQ